MWSATCTMNKRSGLTKQKLYKSFPEDDGRVVADMSQVVRVHMVDLIAPEGLRTRLGGKRPSATSGAGATHPGDSQNQYAQNQYGYAESIELTDGELKALMKASLKAALLLAGVFILAAGLFILFCIYVWFR